jgi:UDP-N-acetylmuramoyl-tripeptide--D-alanyl-D-alanine ligase
MKKVAKAIVVKTLTWQASILLKKHKPMIVAITGSVGKTLTKDAVYSAIKNSISARKSEKSFNSEIGVPLTVLGLNNGWNNPFLWLKNIVDGFFTLLFSKDYPKVLVLEAGIDRPGDMSALTKWVRPNITVLTRLPAVPVHVEFFSSPEEVVQEKMKLVEALASDGVLVYNNDDTIIQAQLPQVRQKAVGYSRYLASDFNTSGDQIIYQDNHVVGTEFTVSHKDHRYTVQLPGTVGTQHLYACSAALAVAYEIGISLESAVKGLQSLETPPGRMRVIPGLKSTTLIDDTYNSSPIAVASALETLKEIKHARRKIAVLGDMLELGKYSSQEHYKIGQTVANTVQLLLTVGVRARKIAEGALASGLNESQILQYDDAGRAGRELQNILQPGDVVLIKASQGIRAERIVEEVMAHPEDAPKLLVRQQSAWLKR